MPASNGLESDRPTARHPLRTLISPVDAARSEYFFAIDLLRGVAALAVVLFHYFELFVPGGQNVPVSGYRDLLPFHQLLWPFYSYGQFAVQLFWLISGFVFAGVYIGRSYSTRHFVISRFARLYPLHLLTLLVVAALQYGRLATLGNFQTYFNNDLYHFVLQLFFASNWGLEQGYSFNAPIWSVSLEVLIYGIFWVSLPFLFRRGLIGPLLLASLFACGSIFNLPGTLFWQCGFYFFTGSAIFISFNILRDKPALFLLGGIIAVAAFAGILLLRPGLGAERLMPLLLPGVLLIFCGIEALPSRSLPVWAHWIGDNTYGTYLWHMPMQFVLLWFLDGVLGSRAIIANPITLILFTIAVAVVARLSFLWIERPSRDFVRRRFMPTRAVAPRVR